jgi:PBSX family phage terminase large subunit
MPVQLTLKQRKAAQLLGGLATNVMLYGGARSGKTFLICWRLLHNALTCPGSRQAVIRKYFNSAKRAIAEDTFPKVLRIENIVAKYHHTDNKFIFPNGSEIWVLGLDDKERTEKLLGQEFLTMYFNECSELGWYSVNMARTRCSMKVEKDIFGNRRRNRIYFDCNPPSKRHWCYRVFVDKIDPETKIALQNSDQWDYMQVNPQDNVTNLNQEYLDMLSNFTGRMGKRFYKGDFTDDSENALWSRDMIDVYRINQMPGDLEKIVVAIDPSGGDGPANCEAGIIVAGKKWYKNEEHYYILDDKTILGSPDVWADTAICAYQQYKADLIVAETNYGGAMVESVICSAKGGKHVGFRMVHASRNKIIRAEPIATMYSRGVVHHVGEFSLLEDEMCSYTGAETDESPNRMDAMVWAVTSLSEGELGQVHVGNYSFV